MTQFYTSTARLVNGRLQVLGGTQDNGTVRTETGPFGWSQILGADGMHVLVSPANTNTILAEWQYCSDRSGVKRSLNNGVVFGSTSGWNNGDRYNWNTPISMDPDNPNILLSGSHRVYRSTTGGASWAPISGDITSTPASLVVYGTITSVAISKPDSAFYLAGTDDGRVWRSQNAGVLGVGQMLSPAGVGAALHVLVQEQNIHRAAAWETPYLQRLGIAGILNSLGVKLVSPNADKHEMALCDLGVTEADYLLPETGTLVLRSSAIQPRAVSLLARIHLAIVRPDMLRPDMHQVFMEAQDGLARLRSVYEASSQIISAADPDEALLFIVKKVCQSMDAWRASVLLIDSEGRPQRLKAIGFDQELRADLVMRPRMASLKRS